LWAVCIAREDLWEYIQAGMFTGRARRVLGGVMFIAFRESVFDRASYFALVGYLNTGRSELIGVPAAFV
jgi:hypothetical protein